MPLGIDLGTTNSSVAWSDEGGTVHSLSVRSGKEPFDAVIGSVVLDPLSSSAVVGRSAFIEAETRDAPLLYSFKPRLDKQRLRETVRRVEYVDTQEYDFAQDTNRARRIVHTEQRLYDPYSRDEVVAAAGHLFRRLLTSQEVDPDPTAVAPAAASEGRGVLSRFLRRSREPATRGPDMVTPEYRSDEDDILYVGVPVAFASTARKRLLAALARSGCFGPVPSCYPTILRRCRLIYEPVALASTLPITEPETVLIVDFGGGTLDLALIDIEVDQRGRTVRERALHGMAQAGDALDAAFMQGMLAKHPDLSQAYDRFARDAFATAAARNMFIDAKVALSSETVTRLPIPGAERDVTRDEFERHVSRSMDETAVRVGDCLARGGCATADVGRVVLTGGSSLIPAFQARIRALFPQLDETRFEAERAGDPASERRALTGVSRGLAAFGFLERFEATTPCAYSIQFDKQPSPTICLPRGAADVDHVEDALPVRVRLSTKEPTAAALYGDLVRRSFSGAIARIAVPNGKAEVDVRIASSRQRFAPAFSIHAATDPRPLALFDMHRLTPNELQTYVEGDVEWLPCSSRPANFFLTRPLRLNDFIEWQTPTGLRRGQIYQIRNIHRAENVEQISDWDPSGHVVYVHPEIDGEIQLSTSTSPHLTAWNVRIY